MAKLPIALQLYSIRQDCAADLSGALKKVAAMGYDGVEFAGFHNHSAADVRRMLDDTGLKVAGAHVGIPTLLGDELKKSVEFHAAIGNHFLIVPGLPEAYRDSAEAWKRTTGVFNAIAAELKPYGMVTGYHNHFHEFKPMDGQIPWEIMARGTNRSVVMQADSGNALHGGADVVPLIRRYPGRARSVHLKEHAAQNPKALIGEGDVRWDELFTVCETVGGTEWYVVEQESYPFPPMDCIRRCRETLQRMGR